MIGFFFFSAPSEPLAQALSCDETQLTLVLVDGRKIIVPLHYYPRLLAATPAERNHYELIGTGEAIHWPDLDEDLSVESIVAGRPSGESQVSFDAWLAQRLQSRAPLR